MRISRHAPALLAICALAVAGCGSDDDNTGDAPPTQTAPVATSAEAPTTASAPATTTGESTAADDDAPKADDDAGTTTQTSSSPAKNPARGSDAGFEQYLKANSAESAKVVEDAGVKGKVLRVVVRSGTDPKVILGICDPTNRWISSTKKAKRALIFADGQQIGSCSP